MTSYTMLNVKMQRDSNSTPWGFRMQGGKDFGCPLQIQKVNPSSLAERCGMQANDYIVKIGQTSTEHLKHPDAQETIKQQNNTLELTLQRGAPPDTNDYNSRADFPPHQLMQSTQNNFSSPSQNRPLPPQPAAPQVAMPVSNNRALLSQAHNTPIGLYSAENVTDTLERTLKSSPPSSHSNNNRNDQKTPAVLRTSDIEELQQKYLTMDVQTNNKSQSRQGPAFRALVKGLDESNESTDLVPSTRNSSNNKQVNTSAIKGFRYTPTDMNITPDYQIEEPKNYNEFKATASRSMPKPPPASASHDFSQRQPRPAPYIASPPSLSPAPPVPTQPKPNGTVLIHSKTNEITRNTRQDYLVKIFASLYFLATNKPSFNVNIQGTPRSGNRVIMKGSKGSASLTRNDNSNQPAVCHSCGISIRGPYISAIGRCYCVDHFTCSKCKANLVDCGFVEENGKLYCENDFEQYLAPRCAKCSQSILKECVHALEKTWHPECFTCSACKKSIGTGSFHVEEGEPYCIEDYRRMFQAKCTSCDFPIEPGDKYLEALGGTYHVECFNCSMCQVSLNGQPFLVKNNRPYCRLHGR
ncbi:unnamed protein product [Rotaria socialis]|uniref:PDZ and LIM domain protein Zasp n=1 Tax=Rotaria socialis TaxID=392032 RepID=A0A820UTJ0_9BILA|nr:unnamed protein product [Rotaria socialis]CAF4490110.1 unnamed protein product [Rotaria socialis]